MVTVCMMPHSVEAVTRRAETACGALPRTGRSLPHIRRNPLPPRGGLQLARQRRPHAPGQSDALRLPPARGQSCSEPPSDSSHDEEIHSSRTKQQLSGQNSVEGNEELAGLPVPLLQHAHVSLRSQSGLIPDISQLEEVLPKLSPSAAVAAAIGDSGSEPLLRLSDVQWDRQQPIIHNSPKPKVPKGSIVGAAALLAGSAVGGGILAVPAVTAGVGFVPTTITMLFVWAFFCSQALLLAEVYLAIASRNKNSSGKSTSMLSMATTTLGKPTGLAVGGMYVLFSNAVLVGQLSRGGEMAVMLLSGFSESMAATYTPVVTAIALATFSLTIVEEGRIGELANRLMTGIIVVSFGVLLVYGGLHMSWAPLIGKANWSSAIGLVPLLLQVLNYLNMIPLVCNFLGRDPKRVRLAIVSGSLVPLTICVLWNGVLVGMSGAPNSPLAAVASASDPVTALMTNGSSWLSITVYLFAASAVLTSVLGTYLALEEFVAEALQGDSPKPFFRTMDEAELEEYDAPGRRATAVTIPALWVKVTTSLTRAMSPEEPKMWLTRTLTVLPSLLVAAISPEAFFSAMQLSGTYFVPAIFCLAPPMMVWVVRYGRGPLMFSQQYWTGKASKPLVPGGQVFLAGMAGMSVCTILFAGEFSVASSILSILERF